MNIIFGENKVIEGYCVVEINNKYYLKISDNNIKACINNFLTITEYTAIQAGDYVEIEKDGLKVRGIVTDDEQDTSNNLEEAKHNHILPYIIHEVKTYPKHTAILGILGGYNKDENWLYNNYGLFWVYIWSEAWTYWTDFKYGNEEVSAEFCPLIKQSQQKRLENMEGLNKEETLEFFKSLISERKYILISLDMYYVIGWKDTLGRNVRHQSIVYGYNDKKKVFYIADFFENNYSIMEIDYERFYNAVTSGAGLTPDSIEYKYNPQLETYEFVDVPYDIDMERIKSFVNDFITSRDHTTDNFLNLYEHRNALYGFEAMTHLKTYLNSAIFQDRQIDLKAIHIIRTYNEVLQKRLEYLLNKGYIAESEVLEKARELCTKVIRKLNRINLLSIKYDCSLNRSTGEKIIEVFDEVIDIEVELLSQVNTLLTNQEMDELETAITFKQYDLAKKIYGEKNNLKNQIKNDELIQLDAETKELFLENNDNKTLKKMVKRHTKGKKIFTHKQLFNVFPYETEESSFIKEGKVVEKQTLKSDIYIYYWQDEDICGIEFLDDSKTVNYMCFDYLDDKIIRYWIAQDADGGYRLLGVKVAKVWHGKVYSIYSYRNWWNNVKINYYTYKYENDKLVESGYYITNDEELPLEYWTNYKWSRVQYYHYDDQNELIQIIREEYGERKTVFSNIIMDEKAVEDKVFDAINYFVDNGGYNIIIKYVTNDSKILISDGKGTKEILFFDDLILEDEEVRRIAYLVALAAYKVDNDAVKYTYFIDDEEVTANKRYQNLLRRY